MSQSLRAVGITRGGIRLGFDAVEVVTHTVESMHKNIARGPLPRSARNKRPHGLIASAVYGSIRAVNGALREGIDGSLRLASDRFDVNALPGPHIRTVAAINGAFGDHLELSGNSLAIPMALVHDGRPLEISSGALATDLPGAGAHLLVMVHGLGLSDQSWSRGGGPGLGARLQAECGYTPLCLRYNSGRHISSNGEDFAQLLDRLCAAWPVPVASLSLVGHSMGGLVIRSACFQAQQAESPWLQHLRSVVCLGTPHHGAPLEQAGHKFDVAMQKLPYTAPLTLGRRRSAGVKDLRHGNLLEEDWLGHHPDRPRPDSRRAVPLVPGVDYYFAAATVGKDRGDPAGHVLGDLLVRVGSAVGAHRDERRALPVAPDNCRVFHARNHFDLLDCESVQQQVVEWLS